MFRSIARTIQLDDVVLLDDVLIGPHNCVRSRKYPAWREVQGQTTFGTSRSENFARYKNPGGYGRYDVNPVTNHEGPRLIGCGGGIFCVLKAK